MWNKLFEIIYSKFIVDMMNIYKDLKKFGFDKTLTNFGMLIYNRYLLHQDTKSKSDTEKLQTTPSEAQKESEKQNSKLELSKNQMNILLPLIVPLIFIKSIFNNIAQFAVRAINSQTSQKIKALSLKAISIISHPTVSSTISIACSIIMLKDLAISSILTNTATVASIALVSLNYVATMVANTVFLNDQHKLLKKLKYTNLVDQVNKELSKEIYKDLVEIVRDHTDRTNTEHSSSKNSNQVSKINAFKTTLKSQFVNFLLSIVQPAIAMNIALVVSSTIASILGLASGSVARYREEKFKLELHNTSNQLLSEVKDTSDLKEIARVARGKLIKLEVVKELSTTDKKITKRLIAELLQKAKNKVDREYKELHEEISHKKLFTTIKNFFVSAFHAVNPLDPILTYEHIHRITPKYEVHRNLTEQKKNVSKSHNTLSPSRTPQHNVKVKSDEKMR